jgi:hypothetical protein
MSFALALLLAAQGGVSENTAFHISLWSTVVPVAAGAAYWMTQTNPDPTDPFGGPVRAGPSMIMASGLVFGPMLGYSAAGLSGRGWKGVGIRSGLTFLSFVPAMAICGWDCSTGDTAYDVAWLMIATGSGLSAAHAIYDIARLKRNVRRHRGTAPAAEPAFSITPTYAPGRSAGVLVHVSF